MTKKAVERLVDFHEYLKSTGYGGRKVFEKAIGMSNGYLSSTLSNNRSIGADVLLKIMKAFPELDMGWLISGEGEMLKSNPSQSVTASIGDGNKGIAVGIGNNSVYTNDNTLKDTDELILNLKQLEIENIQLKAVIVAKDEFIKMLLDNK